MFVGDYYDDMRSKYGFNEGDAPLGIERVRKLIVKHVNKRLKKDPQFKHMELVEFDRPGVHNWCMIAFRDKLNPNELPEGGFIYENLPEGFKQRVRELVGELDEHNAIIAKVVIGKRVAV